MNKILTIQYQKHYSLDDFSNEIILGCETSIPADICQPEAGSLDTSAADAEPSKASADPNPEAAEAVEAAVEAADLTVDNSEFNGGDDKGEKEKESCRNEPSPASNSSENENLLNVKVTIFNVLPISLFFSVVGVWVSN